MNYIQTRYYGSKRKHLSWLRENITDLKPGIILDGLGGTGSVSFLLNELNWNVTYNDIFLFNTISAKALFNSDISQIDIDKLCQFIESIKPKHRFVTKAFDNIFFLREENMWIDGLMHQIEELEEVHKNIILHCLFQSCIRKRPYNLFHRANLEMRVNSTSKNFGNKTTWDRSFPHHIKQLLNELIPFVKYMSGKNKITINESTSASEIRKNFDSVYLDPPYFKAKKTTETYLQRYHFLEGLAQYSQWRKMIDTTSKIKIIRDTNTKEWNKKEDFFINIQDVINNISPNRLILSYISNEFPNPDEITDFLLNSFKKVSIKTKPFSASLSKKMHDELLFICEA
ncbi:DNA adenine methylase [Aquitalea denitrificans]|uniref:DNA adenine methylase n=1 Tax=Aquitalea denitrificans TaxID=519081 RepID=UPI0013589C39|nr:DNA adenine methylase [Aquitalea denitrificans]